MLKRIWNHKKQFVQFGILIQIKTLILGIIIVSFLINKYLGFMLAVVYLSMIIHELGHCLAVLIVGDKVSTIVIDIFSAYVDWDWRTPITKSKIVFMALMGPITNIALAILGYYIFDGIYAYIAVLTNLSLAITNLIPLGFSDGHQTFGALILNNPYACSIQKTRCAIGFIINFIYINITLYIMGINEIKIWYIIVPTSIVAATINCAYMIIRENNLLRKV